MMIIKLYDCECGQETLRAECELIECFPDGVADPEYHAALAELKKTGRFWIGGGAAPLALLIGAVATGRSPP
jgi:hypothetical protein